MSTNIADIDNHRLPTAYKALIATNVVTFGAAVVTGLTGAFFSGGEDYKGANIPMMHLFFYSSLALAIAFVVGLAAIHVWCANSRVFKAQQAARDAAKARLEARYGLRVSWVAINELLRAYVANNSQPVLTHLARFDSVKADGSPASYALRLNADGDFEVWGISGVEWVPVPVKA